MSAVDYRAQAAEAIERLYGLDPLAAVRVLAGQLADHDPGEPEMIKLARYQRLLAVVSDEMGRIVRERMAELVRLGQQDRLAGGGG